MFTEGYAIDFLVVLLYSLVIILLIRRARKGLSIPEIRRIPGIDAIDEAIGRATEMNRPIIFSPGTASDINDPQNFAAFAVLGHVSKKVARYQARCIVPAMIPQMQPILSEIVRQGYMSEGMSEYYRPEDIQFVGGSQWAYASGVVGIMAREGVAVTLMVGPFWAESLLFAEAGAQAGAIQIGGTANLHQLAFMITACDYCMLGEEIYAAGAYLSEDPIGTASLVAQDWGKMFLFVLIVFGCILSTVGKSEWLVNLLNM